MQRPHCLLVYVVSLQAADRMVSLLLTVRLQISRTASKELPVYTDYRHGRTKLVTVLRRHSGDIVELSRQLSAHLQTKVAICNGRLEIVGDHVLEVKAWLAALGF